MTPLNNPETPAEKRYNAAQTGTRVTVERAFGIWKRRFRILCNKMRLKLDNVPSVIAACAVLHNIAIDLNVPGPDDDFEVRYHSHLSLVHDSTSHVLSLAIL